MQDNWLPEIPSGIICKQAAKQLRQWVSESSLADFTGWLAVYVEKPEDFVAEHTVCTDDRLFQIAFDKLSEGPLGDEVKVFVLHDLSVIAAFKNTSKTKLEIIKQHLEDMIYDQYPVLDISLYDLSIQLADFKKLCDQKQIPITQHDTAITMLDDKVLKTPLFKQLLQGRTGRKRLEILLIEDDKMTAQLLHRPLKEYSVSMAHTAADGLKLYSHIAPNICFLDIGLPDYSGLDLLKLIHENDPGAFVIILTANSSETNLHTSLERGIQGFIAKPFTLSKITHYIELYKQKHR